MFCLSGQSSFVIICSSVTNNKNAVQFLIESSAFTSKAVLSLLGLQRNIAVVAFLSVKEWVWKLPKFKMWLSLRLWTAVAMTYSTQSEILHGRKMVHFCMPDLSLSKLKFGICGYPAWYYGDTRWLQIVQHELHVCQNKLFSNYMNLIIGTLQLIDVCCDLVVFLFKAN